MKPNHRWSQQLQTADTVSAQMGISLEGLPWFRWTKAPTRAELTQLIQTVALRRGWLFDTRAAKDEDGMFDAVFSQQKCCFLIVGLQQYATGFVQVEEVDVLIRLEIAGVTHDRLKALRRGLV